MASVAGTINGTVSGRNRGSAVVSLLVMLLGLGWSLLVLRGCERAPMDINKPVETTIGGKRYTLEIAATDAKRHKGMGDRTVIPDGTGMIFVFTKSDKLEFVMRDCPIAIDIVYLDGGGRVTAMHTMAKEEPRKPGEPERAYERRLKQYSSRTAAQFAIEIAADTLKTLNLKTGDKIELDTEGLVKLCKEAEEAEKKANSATGLKGTTK